MVSNLAGGGDSISEVLSPLLIDLRILLFLIGGGGSILVRVILAGGQNSLRDDDRLPCHEYNVWEWPKFTRCP